MSNIKGLPVLILAFNRFDKFKICIDHLYSQGVRKVFVSIDGPRNANDFKIQKLICNYCKDNFLEIDIKINHLKENNGCRLGPLKGITWFFNQNTFGVVLEDDLIISRKCMETFLFLLKKYIHDKKYMSISSFNEFSKKDIELIYSMPVWRSWGWASWADRWNIHLEFSNKIKDYSLFELYKLLPNELKSIQVVEIIKTCQLNLFDAWDYEFNYSHLVNKYNSLTLGGINNYVYGFDKGATHTFEKNSIGVDFDLYAERKINENKIKKYNYSQARLILEKCGFYYQEKPSMFLDINNFIKSIFYTIFIYLRIVKRKIYQLLLIK